MKFRSYARNNRFKMRKKQGPPPRREPRRGESHQPKGPRDGMNELGSVPGYVAAQRMYPAGRNRPYSELSPVETLEGTVSRMQRDLDNLQTENQFLRTRRTTGPMPLVRQAALTTIVGSPPKHFGDWCSHTSGS